MLQAAAASSNVPRLRTATSAGRSVSGFMWEDMVSWGKTLAQGLRTTAPDDWALRVPSDWWIRYRDQEPVKDEFAKTHAAHWVAVVADVLDRNAGKGRTPSSWTGVAGMACAMHVDPGHMSRQKKGGHPGLNGHFFLALAAILDVPFESLFPTKQAWIADATDRLCRGSITRQEAQIFAAYSLAECARQRTGEASIDQHGAHAVAQHHAVEQAVCIAAILKVDRQLSSVLHRLLRGRHERMASL